MPNHHQKDLTDVLARNSRAAQKPLLSATLAEGSQTVKQTAHSPERPILAPAAA